MKNVCILGATGSIGKSTLEVIEKLGPEYKVFAISCCENTELLQKQIEQFKPKYICIANNSSAKINKKLSTGVYFLKLRAGDYKETKKIVLIKMKLLKFPIPAASRQGITEIYRLKPTAISQQTKGEKQPCDKSQGI